MVAYLLKAQKDAKKEMKSYEKDSDEYVALDIRQTCSNLLQIRSTVAWEQSISLELSPTKFSQDW